MSLPVFLNLVFSPVARPVVFVFVFGLGLGCSLVGW